MFKIVLVRHGESVWNRSNRFTGWTDVDLTKKGRDEAIESGKLLKAEGFTFDIAYTSYLRRAIKTLHLILEELEQMWLPVRKTWRLNERHYGALQGLNKAQTAKKFGDEQVHIWRRSYNIPPPPLEKDDKRSPANDPRYVALSEDELPMTESLELTYKRLLPYWNGTLVPAIKSGSSIIIAAHGNSLRALVKHLDQISEKEIVNLNIPTGVPLVYELDSGLLPIRKYYLGDEEAARKKAEAVANQAKNK